MSSAARASGTPFTRTGQRDRIGRPRVHAHAEDVQGHEVTNPDGGILAGDIRPVGGDTRAAGHPDADQPATGSGDAGESWGLVQAAQQGDAASFGRLYDKYVDVVFRYVLFRVGDRTLAEDVTSETFLRAFRRITSISYQGRDVGAWFVTIARNLVLDHVKSSRFRLEVATADPGEGNSVQPGPESQVLAQLTYAELMRCVELLGEDQRECIVLRFLHGLSVSETAAVMDRNEGAIKALQHRAVRRLAQLLPTELR